MIALPAGKKVYFASDFHLGVPNYESSLAREKKVVAWLQSIEKDAHCVFLMGDIFDFWFEHKHSAPKGFVRLLGQLAKMSDKGIQIQFFTGNHDMWMFGYLEKELNATIHYRPLETQIGNHSFFLAHGDGLGPGDTTYKWIKKIFSNRFFQWCYARLHPNLSMGWAMYLSRRSRAQHGEADKVFLGEDKEWLVQYCKRKSISKHYDYMLFGHRHLPLEIAISESTTYINLGDWIQYFTYAEYDGMSTQLKKWE